MKKTDNENVALWSLPMEEAMNRLFAYAEANRVESVTLNVRTHDVRFSFVQDNVRGDEPLDNVCLFRLMKEKYFDLESARGHYESWVDSMIQKPKAEHYQQFVGRGLESLFRSGFLVPDKFVTDDERARARDVLSKVSVDAEGNVDKCVLMLRMVRWEDNRFCFDGEEYIGKYIKQNRETLTHKDFRSFFAFMAHCTTIYTEQDNLEISEMKDRVEECFKSAMSDISQLEKHLAESIEQKSYCKLWQYIIFSKVSLAQKMLRIEPNRFAGGYNKKLVCNIVGMMIDSGVYQLNKNQANDLIYDTNVKSYISNYADTGTDSCITAEERKWIVSVIKDNMPG